VLLTFGVGQISGQASAGDVGGLRDVGVEDRIGLISGTERGDIARVREPESVVKTVGVIPIVFDFILIR